jgi:hypothetical protein
VRIDHVIRSHSAFPFSSHSLPLAPDEDVPRAVIFVVLSSFDFFVSACFLQFSVFSFGGMSIHSHFSTSAAICAIKKREKKGLADPQKMNSIPPHIAVIRFS